CGGEAGAGGPPVAELLAVLRRDDGQHAVHEPTGQPTLRPFLQVRREGGRAGEVERQLDARVGRVHSLTTGARGTGEPPVQLARGQHQRSPYVQVAVQLVLRLALVEARGDLVHHRRVGQRRHVADVPVLRDVAQQPPHD